MTAEISKIVASGIFFLAAGILLPGFSNAADQPKTPVESPAERTLAAYVAAEGAAAIPRLREILLSVDEDSVVRLAAIRHLRALGDKGSAPLFRRLVLEVLDASAIGFFRADDSNAQIRAEAAAALNAMGDEGLADLFWEARSVLPRDRALEVLRLLWRLGDPQAQERMIEVLNTADDDEIAFQAVVELRRNGDARAIPPLREKLKLWRKLVAQGVHPIERGIINRRIRYVEGTIRALERRQPGTESGI